MFYTILIVNALIGLFLFEVAWAKTKLHRKKDEERDSMFPAFRRHDAPNWCKWHFYPIAVTLLPVRLLIIFLSIVVLWALNRILMIGVDVRKFIPNERRKIG